MTESASKPTLQVGEEVLPVKAGSSPVITFELVPTYGHLAGLIDVCVAVTRASVGPNSTTTREIEIVANLRCTKVGATALRDALNGCLLMLEPVENPEGKPS